MLKLSAAKTMYAKPCSRPSPQVLDVVGRITVTWWSSSIFQLSSLASLSFNSGRSSRLASDSLQGFFTVSLSAGGSGATTAFPRALLWGSMRTIESPPIVSRTVEASFDEGFQEPTGVAEYLKVMLGLLQPFVTNYNWDFEHKTATTERQDPTW